MSVEQRSCAGWPHLKVNQIITGHTRHSSQHNFKHLWFCEHILFVCSQGLIHLNWKVKTADVWYNKPNHIRESIGSLLLYAPPGGRGLYFCGIFGDTRVRNPDDLHTVSSNLPPLPSCGIYVWPGVCIAARYRPLARCTDTRSHSRSNVVHSYDRKVIPTLLYPCSLRTLQNRISYIDVPGDCKFWKKKKKKTN
jgi:hypothetical protein